MERVRGLSMVGRRFLWNGVWAITVLAGFVLMSALATAQEAPVADAPDIADEQLAPEDFEGAPEPAPAPEPEPAPEPAPAPDVEETPPAPRPGPPLRPRVSAPERRDPRLEGIQTPERDISRRPRDGEELQDPVHFDFENVPLNKVIESIGAMTGLNFDIDQNIQSPVTIISHSPIPGDKAYEVLESILASRGFDMVPSVDGHLIKVVPRGDLTEKYPQYYGDDAPSGFDRFSTHVVPVRHANAEELGSLLTDLGSQHARVHVYAPTNTLIITDVADGVKNMFKFLREADIPGFDTIMEIFVLEYTRAETLSMQLQDVLMGPEGVPGQQQIQAERPQPARPTAAQQAAARRRAAVGDQQETTVVGAREQVLRIVPDDRLNALIVMASEGMMDQVRDLIDRLDTPTPYEANNMHIYELMNADAEQVAEALNALIGGIAPGNGGEAGPRSGAQPFERDVSVSTYEQTNALLITASPQDYKLIENVIAQLDSPRRQVHVEAIIMEVTINDNYEMSVETTALDEEDFFALSNVIELANILAQGPLGATGAGFTGGIIDGTTEITGPEGTVQTIPNIPLLLTAVDRMTNLNVLSQPSLFATDNEESRIIVGQEVPFISGTGRTPFDGDTQDIGRLGGFTRVNRQDVGIQLQVTPRVNEGDYVTLDIEVEVSQTVESDVGADATVVGPTLSKSQVTNRVVVKDGEVGIIGGLISESTDEAIRQTPILGDLPLLGWLFRQRSHSREKRNLVVLVTPRIVKDERDLERVTQSKLEQFNRRQLDALFEEGFIKRLRSRHYMRNEYRPTEDTTERLMRGETFRRGDMRR